MNTDDQNTPINENNEDSGALKKLKTSKKTAKKKTTKKTISKRASSKTESSKSKKVTSKGQRTKTEKNPFLTFADKTAKLFDSIFDEVKEIPKKTKDIKNSPFVENISTMVEKTKKEFIQRKEEFIAKHNINSQVSESKRKLVQKFSQLGKKTYLLLHDSKLTSEELLPLKKEIDAINSSIRENEKKLNKLLEK